MQQTCVSVCVKRAWNVTHDAVVYGESEEVKVYKFILCITNVTYEGNI